MPRWAIMKRSMLSGGPAYAIALAALLSLHLNTSAQDPRFRAIRRAPPFGIGELGAEFADDRLTNGGSLSNARFSPLTEIDTSDSPPTRSGIVHMENNRQPSLAIQNSRSLRDRVAGVESVRQACVLAGAFIATFIDQGLPSAVSIASPAIAGSIATSADEALWINIAFAAPYYVMILLSPLMLRRFGYRRNYAGSVAGVCVASLLCSTAQHLDTLLLWRFVQGAALRGIFVSTLYAISINFEPAMARLAFAAYAVFSLGGPALGPILGGAAVDAISWRVLFVGLAIATLISAMLLYFGLRPVAIGESQPFDTVGTVFLAIASVTYQIATQYGERRDWFVDPYIALTTVAFVIALLGFSRRAAHGSWQSLIPHMLVNNRRFIVALAVGVGLGVPLLATTVFVNFLLGPLAFTPTMAGQLLALRVCAIVAFAPIFALLNSSAVVDTRLMIAFGFICTAASYTAQAIGTTTISDFRSFILAVLLSGIGFSAIFSPLVFATVGSVGLALAPSALALLKLSFTFGGSLATTALGILLDHAGTQYRSDLTSSLTEGRATIRDFSLSHPHGLFQLDGLLAQQAQTLAYADAAYWTAIATLLFLPLVPFLPAMRKG